jgi:hypothetical protein
MAFLREVERAVKQDGPKGAWITLSLQGSYPDDDGASAPARAFRRLSG